MNFQLTDYGVDLFKNASTPPVLDVFRIGSAFNYLPAPTDTNVRGTVLNQGTPGLPVIVNANIVKYSVLMDTSIGTFMYGECGLFYQGQLVALGANSTQLNKIKAAGAVQGNIVRIDAYLSEVGINFDMNSDQAESSNAFRLSRLQSVDMLPQSGATSVNAFVIAGQSNNQSAVLAFTDKQALWNFSDYAFGIAQEATVTAIGTNSITIAAADYNERMNPTFRGEIIMQFASGPLYSICRFIDAAVVMGATVVMQFSTALATAPNVGDKLWFYRRNLYAMQEPLLPIATATTLGGIKIGTGLIVQADGTCSVDTAAVSVTSVNGQTGIVVVNANNLPGLATVGKTGNYNDLLGKPVPYSLPVANVATLGGIKVGTGLSITLDGTLSANVALPIATPTRLGGVKIGAGINVAADGTISAAAGAIATTTVLGVVKIGSGITVAPDGTISAALGYTLPPATTSTLGGVRVGTGLAIDSSGLLSTTGGYVLPVATPGVLGGVKIGTGITAAADGTISYTLPIATALSLGGVKAGAGVSVAADGTISVTSSYTLPPATGTTLGGVKVGAGVGVQPDGTIFVTPVSDNTKLNRVNGVAQGLFYTFGDQNAGTAAITVDVSLANVGRVNFVGTLNRTWSMVGWPVDGVYAEAQYEFVNAGTAPITFPSNIYFVCPDGTLSNDFVTYIGLQRPGQTNFQASGIDFIVFWSHDAGATIYAKVM